MRWAYDLGLSVCLSVVRGHHVNTTWFPHCTYFWLLESQENHNKWSMNVLTGKGWIQIEIILLQKTWCITTIETFNWILCIYKGRIIRLLAINPRKPRVTIPIPITVIHLTPTILEFVDLDECRYDVVQISWRKLRFYLYQPKQNVKTLSICWYHCNMVQQNKKCFKIYILPKEYSKFNKNILVMLFHF